MPPVEHAARGAIHDIGYRRYDGPRLGRGAIERAMVLQSWGLAFGLGRTARSKVAPLLLVAAICLPPAGFAFAIAVFGSDEPPITASGYLLSGTMVLVSIFLGVVAPSLFSRDVRERTIALHLSRPLGRSGYVRARLAGLVLALLVLLLAPVALLLVASLLSDLDRTDQLVEAARGLGVAALLAGVLAPIAALVASLVTRRGLGVAAIIGTIVLLAAVQGVLESIGADTGSEQLERWSVVVSPFTLVNGIAADLLHAKDLPMQVASSMGVPQEIDFDTAHGLQLLGVWCAVVAVATGLLVLRYRRLQAR
jgi:ABC-2 type transport system permease protein